MCMSYSYVTIGWMLKKVCTYCCCRRMRKIVGINVLSIRFECIGPNSDFRLPFRSLWSDWMLDLCGFILFSASLWVYFILGKVSFIFPIPILRNFKFPFIKFACALKTLVSLSRRLRCFELRFGFQQLLFLLKFINGYTIYVVHV